MKTFFSLLFFCSFFPVAAQENRFLVQVKINNLSEGTHKAFLSVLDRVDKSTRYSDSVSSDNSVVTFTGFLKGEASATVSIEKGGGLRFAIGEGDTIFIELNAKQRTDYRISGSKRAIQMADYYINVFNPQNESLQKLKARVDSIQLNGSSPIEVAKGKSAYDSLYQQYYKFNAAFADTTRSATAVYYALHKYFSDTGKINISSNVERAVQRFDTIVPMKALLNDYNHAKNSYTALAKDDVLDIDKYFTSDLQKKVKPILKRNKLVLIDFWASWCLPCREEFPFLNEAYNQYHAKGFDIISISFDGNKELWQETIQASHTKWKNHILDTESWESQTVKGLNIKTIPRNYLIDANGKIYEKDLRGREVIKALQRRL